MLKDMIWKLQGNQRVWQKTSNNFKKKNSLRFFTNCLLHNLLHSWNVADCLYCAANFNGVIMALYDARTNLTFFIKYWFIWISNQLWILAKSREKKGNNYSQGHQNRWIIFPSECDHNLDNISFGAVWIWCFLSAA